MPPTPGKEGPDEEGNRPSQRHRPSRAVRTKRVIYRDSIDSASDEGEEDSDASDCSYNPEFNESEEKPERKRAKKNPSPLAPSPSAVPSDEESAEADSLKSDSEMTRNQVDTDPARGEVQAPNIQERSFFGPGPSDVSVSGAEQLSPRTPKDVTDSDADSDPELALESAERARNKWADAQAKVAATKQEEAEAKDDMIRKAKAAETALEKKALSLQRNASNVRKMYSLSGPQEVVQPEDHNVTDVSESPPPPLPKRQRSVNEMDEDELIELEKRIKRRKEEIKEAFPTTWVPLLKPTNIAAVGSIILTANAYGISIPDAAFNAASAVYGSLPFFARSYFE